MGQIRTHAPQRTKPYSRYSITSSARASKAAGISNLFCRLLVQDEFEMSGLLHGKILRSFTPQDANHVGCTAMVHVNALGSVANQSTRINIASSRVRYRDRITDRQRDDLIAQSLITTFL